MTVRLQRPDTRLPIVSNNGTMTVAFGLDLARLIDGIESALNAQADLIAGIAAANAAAAAANSAAAVAEAAAETAQTVADDATSALGLQNSYVTGLTLSATDAGSNATVTISAHTRVYGDGTSVSVTGGSLTAQPYSTTLWVYYDQASRAGGAVSYVATATQSVAVQNGDRHVVGAVITPAALGSPSSGRPVPGPGFVEP